MKKIVSIIFIVGIIAFGYLFYKKNPKTQPVNVTTALENISDDFEQNTDTPEPVVAPDIKKVDNSTNTYVHKKYNFTFNFPSNLKTSNFNEGGGEQIQFQGTNGDWFQIYITPWDEGDTITPERIKKDIPDIVIKDPQQVILGPNQKDGVGPHALIFISKDSSLGETREVWFAMNGNLYQVTTYKKLDTLVGKVLSTLVFK
jgi:hypothetical protein